MEDLTAVNAVRLFTSLTTLLVTVISIQTENTLFCTAKGLSDPGDRTGHLGLDPPPRSEHLNGHECWLSCGGDFPQAPGWVQEVESPMVVRISSVYSAER